MQPCLSNASIAREADSLTSRRCANSVNNVTTESAVRLELRVVRRILIPQYSFSLSFGRLVACSVVAFGVGRRQDLRLLVGVPHP